MSKIQNEFNLDSERNSEFENLSNSAKGIYRKIATFESDYKSRESAIYDEAYRGKISAELACINLLELYISSAFNRAELFNNYLKPESKQKFINETNIILDKFSKLINSKEKYKIKEKKLLEVAGALSASFKDDLKLPKDLPEEDISILQKYTERIYLNFSSKLSEQFISNDFPKNTYKSIFLKNFENQERFDKVGNISSESTKLSNKIQSMLSLEIIAQNSSYFLSNENRDKAKNKLQILLSNLSKEKEAPELENKVSSLIKALDIYDVPPESLSKSDKEELYKLTNSRFNSLLSSFFTEDYIDKIPQGLYQNLKRELLSNQISLNQKDWEIVQNNLASLTSELSEKQVQDLSGYIVDSMVKSIKNDQDQGILNNLAKRMNFTTSPELSEEKMKSYVNKIKFSIQKYHDNYTNNNNISAATSKEKQVPQEYKDQNLVKKSHVERLLASRELANQSYNKTK